MESVIAGAETSGRWGLTALAFDDARVELLGERLAVELFSESLEALELAEGPVHPPTGVRTCKLAEPLATYELSEGSWLARDPLFSDTLVPDRARRCLPCARFQITRAPLDTLDERKLPGAYIQAATRVGARAIVAPGYGGLLVVDLQSSQRLEGCDDVYVGLFATSESQLFATTASGSVQRTHLDLDTLRCEVEHRGPGNPLAILNQSAGLRGDGPEIFMSAVGGAFLRASASHLERVGELASVALFDGMTAWLGPGRGAFVTRTAELGLLDDSGFRIESFERFLQFEEQLVAVGSVSDLGLVVGTDRGALYRRVNGAWAGGTLSVTQKSGSIVTYRDGLIAAQGSTVIQVRSGWRPCEETQIVGAQGNGRNVVVVGDRLLLPSEINPDGKLVDVRQRFEAIWLTPE
ncbi:MAG: hypothetical protein HYV07_19220 [Deltaproteobacteria bacterium]|nr:hypothetical protein [Deltaproteobacteria bacterium]